MNYFPFIFNTSTSTVTFLVVLTLTHPPVMNLSVLVYDAAYCTEDSEVGQRRRGLDSNYT